MQENRERETDKQTGKFPIYWFTLQIQQSALGQAEGRSPKVQPGLPCGFQGAITAASEGVSSRKLESGVGPELEPWHSDVGYRCPEKHPNC